MGREKVSVRHSTNTGQRTFPTATFYLLFLSAEFYLALHRAEDTVLLKTFLNKFPRMYSSVYEIWEIILTIFSHMNLFLNFDFGILNDKFTTNV